MYETQLLCLLLFICETYLIIHDMNYINWKTFQVLVKRLYFLRFFYSIAKMFTLFIYYLKLFFFWRIEFQFD